MKRLYTFFFTISLVLALSIPTMETHADVDEKEIKEKLPFLHGQSNIGKEYWFSIPPVYDQVPGDNFIKVMLTAPVRTKVTVEIPGAGFQKVLYTIPNDVITFDLNPAIAQPTWHTPNQQPPPARVYQGRGINVKAESPVVVYVMCRFNHTSDGFLAIPTNTLGTDYRNMTYQEGYWQNSTAGIYPPWTTITGAYDNTEISFTMGGGPEGEGIDKVPLANGRDLNPGETTTERLNKGDVWLLTIKGNSQDLSGSIIKGNKPFAVVSGVFCSWFPQGNFWCDYSVEMELPTHTWGKKYYIPSVPNRAFNSIIRVFAKEDNTTIYRDGTYLATIKKGGGAPPPEGYWEGRLWPKYDGTGQQILPKPATIHADKPIMVMLYNTGVQEDQEVGPRPNSDPFMLIHSPIEQFQTEALFASPNARGTGGTMYSENYINIVYEVNEEGLLSKDLKFAEMKQGRDPEWVAVRDEFTGSHYIFTEEHEGKRYATKTLTMPQEGVFGLKSETTKFAAYSFGYWNFDSYGFPTTAALKDLTSDDIDAPVPEYVQECNGDVLKDMGTVTDKPDDATIRSNLADIYLIQQESYNYDLEWRAANGQFIPGETVTASWWLEVIDRTQPAKAVIYFTDFAGNDTTITVTYNPPEFEVVDDHNYGLFKTNDPPKTHDFYIKNLSEGTDLYVTSIMLKGNNQGFSIVGTGPGDWVPNDPSKPIPPEEERIVTIQFDPAAAPADDKDQIFFDSLGVGVGEKNKEGVLEECQFDYLVQVRAEMGAPVIEVTDVEFAPRNINIDAWVSKKATIYNRGNAPLSITGISKDLTNTVVYRHSFLVDHPNISEANPLILDPGQDVTFNVEFKPDAEETFPDEIIFESDAGEVTDPVCVINGEGIVSEMFTEGLKWTKHLINRPAPYEAGPYEVDPALNDETEYYIRNEGSDDNQVKEINFELVSGEGIDAFKARLANGNIIPLRNWFINVLQTQLLTPNDNERRVEVLFQPTSIGEHEVNVVITPSQAGVEGDPITANFYGIGGVPRITVTPSIEFDEMLIDNEADAEAPRMMTITNESHEFDYELTFDADPISFDDEGIVKEELGNWNGETFGFDLSVIEAANGTLDPGQSIHVPVEFVARIEDLNEVNATVHSNAEESSEQNESHWFGNGYVLGATLDEDRESICVNTSSNNLTLTLRNTSSQILELNGLRLVTDNLQAGSEGDIQFVDNSYQDPFEMAVGEEIEIKFNFQPTAVYPPTEVTVKIDHDYNPEHIDTRDGTLTVSSFEETSSSTSDIPGIAPEQHNGVETHMVSIGESFDYEVTFIPEGDEFHQANANRFRVEVTFNDDYVKPYDIDTDEDYKINPGYAGWIVVGEVLVEETQDPELSKLVFTIEGDVITEEGVLFTIPFLTVLPSFNEDGVDNQGVVDAGEHIAMNHTLTNDNPDGCFTHTSEGLIVGVREICMDNTRLLYISGESTDLPSMVPNPVTSDGGTIKYSVSHDQPGQLVIYNSMMQKVATLVDGELKEGKHEVNIPIEQLSSGAYFYELKTTNGREIQKMIINK